ncbi:hypothetical protein ACT3TY_17120 [Halomonas sp. AOP22-C1-8]|uniref:hypothetical protein n=1 Tax=Halomonas sp. AOP22-C1-8 TaxID=3457717 RepID=UPI004034C75C
MASFTVRMVLKGGEWDDYEKLYDNMRRKGFTKTIFNGNGEEFQLPDGEYNYIGESTRVEVLDKAKQAATELSLPYSVLVTESMGRKWYRLDKV